MGVCVAFYSGAASTLLLLYFYQGLASCKHHPLSCHTGKDWLEEEIEKAHVLRCCQNQPQPLWLTIREGQQNSLYVITTLGKLQTCRQSAILGGFLWKRWPLWVLVNFYKTSRIWKAVDMIADYVDTLSYSLMATWMLGLSQVGGESWGRFTNCLNFVSLNSHRYPLTKWRSLTGSEYLRLTSD